MPWRLDVDVSDDPKVECRSSYALAEGERLLIGSREPCDLLFRDPLVAEEHAEIVADDEGLLLRNLDPELGVIVDGVLVTDSLRLADRHRIKIAGHRVAVFVRPGLRGGSDRRPDALAGSTDRSPRATPPRAPMLPAAAVHAMEHVRREFGDGVVACHDEARLHALVKLLVEKAAGLGVNSESDLADLLRCIVLTGDPILSNETRHPGIRATLTHTDRPVSDRLRRMLTQARHAADPGVRRPLVAVLAGLTEERVELALRLYPQTQVLEPGSGRARAGGGERAAPRLLPERVFGAGGVAPGVLDGFLSPYESSHPRLEGFDGLTQMYEDEHQRIFHAREKETNDGVSLIHVRRCSQDAFDAAHSQIGAWSRLRPKGLRRLRGVVRYGAGCVFVCDRVDGVWMDVLLDRFREVPAVVTNNRSLQHVLERELGNSSAFSFFEQGEEGTAYFRIVRAWLLEVADVLGTMHAASLPHGHFDPSCVSIGPDGHPTVAGLEEAALGQDGRSLEDMAMRRRAYMAPERLIGGLCGATISRAGLMSCDIWSFGALLYEMLCLRPVRLGSGVQVFVDAATADPVSPSQVVWQVPKPLEDVAERCLERDPHRRFASFLEVSAALQDAFAPAARSTGVFARKRPADE